MELWAVARYDLGLSDEEFLDLTPEMFKALCKRREVKYKHERFANALTASTVWNAHFKREDGSQVTPWDFVRDAKEAQADEQTRTLKKQINDAVVRMPANTTREKFMRLRSNIVRQLGEIGRTDAAELWAECWPNLVPEGE